ncbi:MAG: ATP-binding cassette domain-containing protein, partial [Deltaproteobacteria bacterium]
MPEAIVVERVGKHYPEGAGFAHVLRDCDLRIETGEFVSLIGPSGSGKSTLLAILGGLDEPTAGSVRLDGVDPFALDARGRAAYRNRRIGFVFQEHHLLAGCSALDNVVLPALAEGGVSRDVE